MSYIFGIDPGLLITGVCVLKYEKNNFQLIYKEEIKTSSKDPIEKRLYIIYEALEIIFSTYPVIQVMGLEESYMNMNAKSSLKLSMVVGILLLFSVKYNLRLKIMSSTHIKKNITGKGHASKELMYTFVSSILSVPSNLSHHLYDAIAIAILAV